MSTSPLPLNYRIAATSIVGDINVNDVFSNEVTSVTVEPNYNGGSWSPTSYMVKIDIGVSDSTLTSHGVILAVVEVPSLNDAVFLLQQALHMDPAHKVAHPYVQFIIDFVTTQAVSS